MNNLVIIGNGFDLAHDLKTSYTNFIQGLLYKKKNSNPTDYSDLFLPATNIFDSENVRHSGNRIGSNNRFFNTLINSMLDKNWCDIEKEYYKQLLFFSEQKFQLVVNLNAEFNIIKKYLEQHLSDQENFFKPIRSYSSFFSLLDSSNQMDTLILNFNYTNTVKEYGIKNAKIINIHGELFSEQNPIIFGYAASESETRALQEKDEEAYLINIKKFNYGTTNNQNELLEFLDNKNEIEIFILGHSIGLSDSLILNDILTHKNISSIRNFYFQSLENYKGNRIRIDRICNGFKHNYNVIKPYPETLRMPQYNDSEEQHGDFINKVTEIINNKENVIKSRSNDYKLPLKKKMYK